MKNATVLSSSRKRLYRVVIGFESLFAVDEVTSLDTVLEERIEEVISEITPNDIVGIVGEEEYDSIESFESLPGDWQLNGIPFSIDEDYHDSLCVSEYKNRLLDSKKKKLCGCPFCGAESCQVEVNTTNGQWQAHCTSCGAKGPFGSGIEEVVEQWNDVWTTLNGHQPRL